MDKHDGTIGSVDQACLDAFAAALGHPAPFTPEELAGIRSLSVTHARDLSALAACTGLRHLRVLASDVPDFFFCETLPELEHLEVLATKAGSLKGTAFCKKLERIDLLFTTASDAWDVMGASSFRRGTLIGNLWDDSSWSWLKGECSKPGMLVELPSEHDWKLGRELWEKDGACWGLAAEAWPLVVRPGLPALTKNAYDALQTVWLRHELKQPGFSVANLFAGQPDAVVAPDLSAVAQARALGSAEEARRWIADAAMPEADKADLDRFVRRFPDVPFYRASGALIGRQAGYEKFALPAWYRTQRETLDGWQPNAPHSAVRLDGDDSGQMTLKDWWLGLYPHATDHEAMMLKAGFVNIALSTVDQQAFLAMRLQDDDRQIYAYHLADVRDAVSEGRDIGNSFRPAFRSYAAMLGHITALLPHGQDPIPAA